MSEELCRSNPNGGNLISGINACAAGVVLCNADGIVEWTVEDLASMDRRYCLGKFCNEWLFAQQHAGVMMRNCICRGTLGDRRRLISNEECVGIDMSETKSLHTYLRESTEWMLQPALKEKVIVEEETPQDYHKRTTEQKVRNWKRKALHGSLFNKYHM